MAAKHRNIIPLKRHNAKTRHSTRHLTPWHSPQTPTAPQRQTTRGKTLLFCNASRTKIFDLPQPQNGPRSPKNHENESPPWLIIFSTTVPQMVENTVKNEGARNFEKNNAFCDVHFSLGEKHMFVKPCLKQHAFLVDPLRDSNGLSNAHTLIF